MDYASPQYRYMYANNPEPRHVKFWRTLRYRLALPLWWRLETRCMGWYDCIPRDSDPEQWNDYPWHVRFLFHLEPLKEVVNDANTQL